MMNGMAFEVWLLNLWKFTTVEKSPFTPTRQHLEQKLASTKSFFRKYGYVLAAFLIPN